MIIEALLETASRRRLGSQPEADALTEQDALLEADLVGIRVREKQAHADLLFDLRTSNCYRDADTAVLSVGGVIEFEWKRGTESSGGWESQLVMRSTPSTSGDQFTFSAVCLRGWDVRIVGRSAEFFVGDTVGLPDVQPNFGSDDESTIRRGMQNWMSDLDVVAATFIDGSPAVGWSDDDEQALGRST